MGLTDYLVLAIVALLILWGVFAAIKKYWPTSASSGAGAVIGIAADQTQAWSAYAALSWIRFLDSVEADPAAIEACELLRNTVTQWKRPSE